MDGGRIHETDEGKQGAEIGLAKAKLRGGAKNAGYDEQASAHGINSVQMCESVLRHPEMVADSGGINAEKEKAIFARIKQIERVSFFYRLGDEDAGECESMMTSMDGERLKKRRREKRRRS